jgi:hypothetical protein
VAILFGYTSVREKQTTWRRAPARSLSRLAASAATAVNDFITRRNILTTKRKPATTSRRIIPPYNGVLVGPDFQTIDGEVLDAEGRMTRPTPDALQHERGTERLACQHCEAIRQGLSEEEALKLPEAQDCGEEGMRFPIAFGKNNRSTSAF